MTHPSPLASPVWRLPQGLALLGAVSALLTLGFACAAPLAALGAIAALTMSRRAAFLATGAAWLSNQIVGCAVLDYPMDAVTLAWGAALGAAALAACAAAAAAARQTSGLAASGAALLAAFAAYEGGVILASVVLQSGLAFLTLDIMARLFAIHATAFVLLLAASRLAAPVGEMRPPFACAAPRA